MQVLKKYKLFAFAERMWSYLSSNFENVQLHREILVLAEVFKWNENTETNPKKYVI